MAADKEAPKEASTPAPARAGARSAVWPMMAQPASFTTRSKLGMSGREL